MNKINFVTNKQKLKQMAYGDSVYAWLLLHSHYDEVEEHNYIYKRDFTFTEIGRDIHRTRQTVSKNFEKLLKSNEEQKLGKDLLYEDKRNGVYILPCFKEFAKLNADTVLNLFWLCGQGNTKRKEELVKLYAWLKTQYKNNNKNISFKEIIEAMGHSCYNEEIYNRYKDLLTTLQGAGLIKFRTDLLNYRTKKGEFDKTLYVYKVNDKASQEWLDKKNNS